MNANLFPGLVDVVTPGEDGVQRGAVVSDCGLYRYALTRRWSDAPPLVVVMLNPSTADGAKDDPTVRKVIGFSRRNGGGGIVVVNLFAYRSTDPSKLARVHLGGGDAVGPANDAAIRGAVRAAPNGAVVVAWGAYKLEFCIAGRVEHVVKIITDECGVSPLCWGRSKDGSPRHPLRLAYSTPLETWEAP